jgi:methyl-accepting chemotaxis protein WspA
MKPITIWQRLDRVLLLLILLLLSGVGLAVWISLSCSDALQVASELAGVRHSIGYELMVLGEAERNIAQDPKNALESKRREDTRQDLSDLLERLQDEFRGSSGLLRALAAVREFALGSEPGSLGELHNHLLTLAGNDPANALTYFNANYPALARQRDALLNGLAQESDLVAEAQRTRALTMGIIGGASLLLIALASLLVRRFQSSALAEPLQRLVATLDLMREGDFTHRLSLAQQDELGAIGEGLNRLADGLSDLVGQIQHSGLQVNTTATQISASTREQSSASHQLAATTAQIGSASKQISVTSKELLRAVNEVIQGAEQTARLAGTGQSALGQIEEAMGQILEGSSSITARLAVLSDKTANINSVVTTISKVADQTNLLSLNAAIEAEKAGEYGLGFAVVAMEIRRLADQTAVATYDIEKMVKEMQSAAAAGVMGMDKFSEQVRSEVEAIRQVGTHLAQIIQHAQALAPRFQTVTEGMHLQAAGAQQISETLAQLNGAARRTADTLHEFDLAIERLNTTARGLQTSAARFKLLQGGNQPAAQPNGQARERLREPGPQPPSSPAAP